MFKKKKKQKPTTALGRIWYFIWEEDSVLSWIVNIILAFVIIKFLIYPGLGLVLGGTQYPVVAVVSGSMEHKISENTVGFYSMCGNYYQNKGYVNLDNYWGQCGQWYEDNNITKNKFSKFKFKNGFNKGDIMVLYNEDFKDIKTGDVIVYKGNLPDPIIHRVVKTWEEDNQYFYQTKGDHNQDSAPYETSISEDRVFGKAVIKIPYLGWVKIWFVNLIKLVVGA